MPRAKPAPMAPTERADLSATQLRCRIYGHAWDDFYPDDLGTPLYGWRLSLRCTRCGTERHDIVDRLGRVNGRHYIYQDGYKIAKDETPSRDEMRQAILDTVRNKLLAAHAINEKVMEKVG